MTKLFLFTFFALSSIFMNAQSEAQKIVDKSIKLHDPHNNWNKFSAEINLNSIVERNGQVDTSSRIININLKSNIFDMTFNQDVDVVNLFMSTDTCYGTVINDNKYSKAQLAEKNISCERAKMYNDYFQYLIGIPMKLKDPGTIIHPELSRREYKGKEYDVVTVTYDPKVGNYTWLFYFDTKSAELILTEFSKDGTFQNGETIELNNKVNFQKMMLPGQLIWYVLPDRPFLADEKFTYRKSKKFSN